MVKCEPGKHDVMKSTTPEYLLIQINELTSIIETNYPELYTFLEEQPNAITSENENIINEKHLSDYLESLNQLLKHHVISRNLLPQKTQRETNKNPYSLSFA